jgi:hypothetical protein
MLPLQLACLQAERAYTLFLQLKLLCDLQTRASASRSSLWHFESFVVARLVYILPRDKL